MREYGKKKKTRKAGNFQTSNQKWDSACWNPVFLHYFLMDKILYFIIPAGALTSIT